MASTGIMQWLAVNHSGDVGDFMKALGLTLDEANARVLALECEGMIEHYAYRWDGTPVYRLVMETEHKTEAVMESDEPAWKRRGEPDPNASRWRSPDEDE